MQLQTWEHKIRPARRLSKLLANTIGKIAKPDRNATITSKIVMIKTLLTIEVCLGKYAPYVSIQPAQQLKVKRRALRACDDSRIYFA